MTGGDTATASTVRYVYDPGWELETQRLLANEAIWDTGTIHHLRRIGVTGGWRCLELGAGCGSIARHLADLVAPGGEVVATDLVTERLDWLADHGVTVWRHDVVADDLPSARFDLIHARMLAQHLPELDLVVSRLVRSLRPGGWLYLEDTDPSPVFRAAVPDDALAAVAGAGYAVMRAAGFNDRGG